MRYMERFMVCHLQNFEISGKVYTDVIKLKQLRKCKGSQGANV